MQPGRTAAIARADERRRARWAPLETFRSVSYRYLWSASVLWNLARWMDQVVLGWVVLEMTNSAWHVALVGVVRWIPVLLFGVAGGAIADRFDRRYLLAVSQGGGALVSLGVWIAIATGRFSFELAALAGFLLGLQWAVDWPARRALIPDLVGRDLVMNAVALEAVSMNITRIVGPIGAGALIRYFGSSTTYAAMAAFYAVEIALLLAMPLHSTARSAPTGSLVRYLREGWIELRSSQPIVGVLLITVFMNMFAFPYQQILSVFARDVFDVDAFGLGLLGAAGGIGSLAGTLVLASRGRVRRAGRLFAGGSVLMSLCLVGFGLTSDFVTACALLVLSGLAMSTFSAFQSTIILDAAPATLRGRAMGALTLAIGSTPLGLLEIGLLTSAFGAQFAIASNAVACVLLCLVVAAVMPGFRRVD